MDFLSKIRKHLSHISLNDDIQKYSTKTYAKMNEFRLQNKLCDVNLKVQGKEFPAHRIVLAAASDFFSAMFSCGMSESEQAVVELKSISLDIISEILDYVYTGNVIVTNDNVQELLPAANLTQLIGLKQACCIYLMRQIDCTNVLGIRRFSDIHDCPLVEKFARKYAAHNMEAVLEHSEEFVHITRSELRQLLRTGDLNVYSEESVYNAVIRWIYYNKEGRAKWLPQLLSKVRLCQLSIKFLTEKVSSEVNELFTSPTTMKLSPNLIKTLISNSLECRDLVDEAKFYHLRPDLRATIMKKLPNERFWSRSDGSNNHFLVLVGGFGSDQTPINSVEIFDPRSQRWATLPSLPGRYRYVAACSIASCIYVIGGFDGRERLSAVSVLDISNTSQGWMELAPMHFKRGLAATCVYNGNIYVCGGFDGVARLKSLEVYDPNSNQWTQKESMETSREGAGLVVVDNFLYCVGGYNGMQLLDTVERYDIRLDSWTRSESMHYRRSGAGCAVMNETIYVCGGYGGAIRQGPQHLDSVECFNTLTQQWSFITNMQEPRCYIGACQMDNMIWVAAGYDGNRLLNTVEAYDRYGLCSATVNAWITFKSCPMRHERCDTGMCMVRLFQLAEPVHRSTTVDKNLKTEHHTSEESSRNDDGAFDNERSTVPGAAAASDVTTDHDFRVGGINVLFPLSAPYNSQSGQPVPGHISHNEALVFDTYPFDEGGGAEEVEGRGGPQLNILGQSPVVSLDVPGSVQGGPEGQYSITSANLAELANHHHHRTSERTSRYVPPVNSIYITTVEANTNSPAAAVPTIQQSGRSTFRHTSSISPYINYEQASYIDSSLFIHDNYPRRQRTTNDRSSLSWPARVTDSVTDNNTPLFNATSTNENSGFDNQNALSYLDRVLHLDRYESTNSLSSDDNDTTNDSDTTRTLLNASMPFLQRGEHDSLVSSTTITTQINEEQQQSPTHHQSIDD